MAQKFVLSTFLTNARERGVQTENWQLSKKENPRKNRCGKMMNVLNSQKDDRDHMERAEGLSLKASGEDTEKHAPGK